jgi:hypothetical protein
VTGESKHSLPCKPWRQTGRKRWSGRGVVGALSINQHLGRLLLLACPVLYYIGAYDEHISRVGEIDIIRPFTSITIHTFVLILIISLVIDHGVNTDMPILLNGDNEHRLISITASIIY